MFKTLMGGLVAVALAATPALAQTALQPVKFISSDPTLTSALVYLMQAKGFDKAHGLAVEIAKTGNSSSLQVDAVVAGHADFGAPGTQTALQAMREGADMKIIGSISNNQLAAVVTPAALKKAGVSPDAPIGDRVRAMKGMTIAVNPVGSTYYQMFRAYLKQYGLNPDRDVTLVGLGDANAMLSGIEQGRYDAIVSASGLVEQAIAMKTAELYFNGARGDFPGASSTVVCVVVARTEVVEKHPDEVEKMKAAFADTLDYVNTHHDEVGAYLRANFFPKFDQAVWSTVWANATAAYPKSLTFPKAAYDFWTTNDPKGADSFKSLGYEKAVYGPTQGS
jgi:NitT/TauT family transport system substrate-binding protein